MSNYLRGCALLASILIYSSSSYASCNDVFGSSCKVANCNTAQLQIKNQTSNSIVQINSVDYSTEGVFTVAEGCCSSNDWPATWNVSNYNINPGQSITVWGHEIGGDIGANIYITVSKNINNTITQTTTATLEASASDLINCLWGNSVKNLSSSQYYKISSSSTNGSYSGAVATFTINDAD